MFGSTAEQREVSASLCPLGAGCQAMMCPGRRKADAWAWTAPCTTDRTTTITPCEILSKHPAPHYLPACCLSSEAALFSAAHRPPGQGAKPRCASCATCGAWPRQLPAKPFLKHPAHDPPASCPHPPPFHVLSLIGSAELACQQPYLAQFSYLHLQASFPTCHSPFE